MMKKIIIILLVVIVLFVLFLTIRSSSYNNTQSQCEHYKDAQKQQERIQNDLEDETKK